MFFVPITSCSIGREVFVPKEGMLLPEDTTMILLNWKLRLPSGYLTLRVAPFGLLLGLPCLLIKVNGKLQQPNPGRTTNGLNPSGMKFCVTPRGKEP